LHQQINDATAGRVQRAIDTAIALRRELIQLARGEPFFVGQTALMFGTLLVIALIEALDGFATDQARGKPWFIW